MNDFLVIYLKQKSAVVLENILSIVRKDYSILEMWEAKNSNLILLNILNKYSKIESKDLFPRINYMNKRYTFLYSGYITEEYDSFVSKIQFRNGSLYAEPSGGIASFCLYDELSKKVFLWSTLPPVKPLFYSESKDMIVVGTRPKIVHLSTRKTVKVKLSTDYIPAVVADGYALDDITVFDETYVCPIRKTLVIHQQWTDYPKIVFEPYPVNPYQDLYEADFDTKVELLCNELVKSVSLLKKTQNPQLWLSGGKDSRLLAAVLKAAEITPYCVKHGYFDDKESQVASLVASKLNFPFQTVQPQFNSQGDLSDSVKHSLVLSDGFINPATSQITYDATSAISSSESLMLGHAHLQKGGFARRTINHLKPIVDTAHSKFMDYSHYIKPMALNRNKKIVNDFISNFNVRAVLEILYWINFDFRVAKYLLPQYLEFSSQMFPVYPLIDEKVCRVLSGLKMNDKIFEFVMFGAIRELAPEIANVPLYHSKWKFEQGDKPYPGFEDGYEARTSTFVPDNIRLEDDNKQSKNFKPNNSDNTLKQSELNSPFEFSGKLGMKMFDRISNSSIFLILKEYLKDEVCLAISECNYNHIVALNQKCQVSNRNLTANFIWLLYSLVILYDEF